MTDTKSKANLSKTQRDIIILDIPYIYDCTLSEMSFQLSSPEISISLPTDKIYSIQNALQIIEGEKTTKIKCNKDTKITLFGRFIELQNPFYFPFISSDFSLEISEVDTMHNVSLQIHIPVYFTLLDRFSHVFVNSSPDKPLERYEVWGLEKRFYYFLINNEGAKKGFIIQFRARVKEEKFLYGVYPIILPIFTLLMGLIFILGKLPENIASPIVFFTIILALTPFYLKSWLESKTFIGWNLGVGIYIFSYIASIGFIVVYLLFLKYIWIIWIFYLISVIGLFIFSRGMWEYYAVGKFGKLSNFFFKLVAKIITLPYKPAYRKQEKLISHKKNKKK